MNWKKILLYGLGGGIAGKVAGCADTVLSGVHCAFTVGNLILPVIPGVIVALAALFTHRPQDH